MIENKEIKDKLLEINQIFDELIGDAISLSKDLVFSIKQWLVSSIFWFLAAGFFFWYVAYPMLISGNIMFIWNVFGAFLLGLLGFFSVRRYVELREKYARLFAIQKALSKEK